MMRTILVMGVAAAVLVGCAGDDSSDGRVAVVASFFPLADAAREVGGAAVDVRDLTPAGAEPHDLELSTRDVERLLDADVAVVLGGGFQPGVERVAERRDSATVVAEEVPGVAHGDDPHVWLDPTKLARVVDAIGQALDEAGVAGAEDRADAYRRRLEALDEELATGLAGCRGKTLVVAHEAFGHLARRYGLKQLAISGLSPEEEADPRTLDRLATIVRDEQVPTVFAETILSPDVARTLAREAGAEVAILDPIESGDGTYIEMMRRNLGVLRDGLRC